MWWIWYKVHSSWHVALACLLFVAGVAMSLAIRIPAIWGLILFPVLIGCFFHQAAYMLLVVGSAGFIIGLSYGTLHLVSRAAYTAFFGQTVTAEGRVKEDITLNASGNKSIQIEAVRINDVPLPGSVLITARSSGEALRGDTVRVLGQVREGFGSFPASISATKIISVHRQAFGDIGRVVRDGFADKVRQVITEPQASLGVGFLTGQKSALPTDVSDSLKVAGLTHIVVASGYNLTILVRMARKLLLKVSKYLSALSAGAMVLAFIFITGLSPSMTRAGLVSSMSLLTWYYGHTFHPFVLLPVAAALTVLFQPSYVWGDLGWQLSFSAFAGVMIVSPLLQAYFFGTKEPGVLRQILGETIAAHLVTMPIIAISFGTISHVAIVANLLVVPLVPLAMLLTFICGIGVLVGLPIISWVALPTTWLLGYMTHVASFVSDIPWAQTSLALTPVMWGGYAALLVAACVWMWCQTRFNFRTGEPTFC